MAGQNLEQALHIDDNSIVENVRAFLHVLGSCLLKCPLDILFNLFTALVFGHSVDFQDSVDCFFNCLLVTLFANLDDLSNADIL